MLLEFILFLILQALIVSKYLDVIDILLSILSKLGYIN